ncbi:MAG: STAS/SEC14 domain-containing protein [Candidatus Aminicenantes bacterium]|nr:STAS/SEC14 domain-containing protein [Candidatus Aminicenantes bacterium]
MKDKTIETRTAAVSLDDGGFVRIVINSKAEIDLKDITEINKGIRKFNQGEKIPIFLDARGTKSITREARSFGDDEKSTEVTKAVAFLIGNPVSRVIGNFFLGLNKPPFPFKMFTSEEKAIRWLKEFL